MRLLATPPLRAVLVDPEGRERSALLQGARAYVRVGRAPENDIQVISPYISRRHAELTLREGKVLFRDLRSTSGSYMEGRRVDEVLLAAGDAVRLGAPDGIRLSIQRQEQGTWPTPQLQTNELTAVERPDSGPHNTEVVQIAAPDSSAYLSARAPAPNQRDTTRQTEERLRTLIQLTDELLAVGTADAVAERLLTSLMELLPVERGMVLLRPAPDEAPEPVRWLVRGVGGGTRIDPLSSLASSVRDFSMAQPELPFHPIRTVTDRVFTEGVGMLTLDAPSDQRLEGSKSVMLQSVRSILAAPLTSGDGPLGVLYLDTRRALRKSDGDALDFLMAVARQAGTVLRQLELRDRQKRMMESMMRGLAASIDKRDGLTAGHSARVAHYSVGMARELGLDDDAVYAIYYAALLHDYGKIGVDDAVLKKPARLTDAEYEHIKLHPRYTYDILGKIEFPPELANLPMVAASHHERMDGAGYPFGLVGEEIPLGGRIIAVADVYDSLTRKRHYRDPMPMEEVLKHLEDGRGPRFDGRVLDAFFRYHEAELAAKEARRLRRRQQASTVEGPLRLERAAKADLDEDGPGQRTTRRHAPVGADLPEDGEDPTLRLDP